MSAADPVLRSVETPTQLKFRTKTTTQASFDEAISSFSTPHEDPLRILVPAQKKLSTIESQRVLSVVDETAQHLEAALAIPSLADSLERLSVPLGSELVKLLQEYRDIATELEGVTEKLNSLGRSSTPTNSVSGHTSHSVCSSIASGSAGHRRVQSPSGCVEDQFYNLQLCIRHNVKSVLRAVSANPSLLQAVHHKKSMTHTQLMEDLRGLRSVSNEMLLTTRMEEIKRKEHLQLVTRQRLSAEESIKRLEIELVTAQKQKDEEVSEKNAQIKQLNATIKTVAELAKDTTRKVRTEAEKQQNQAETTHSTVKSKLEEEILTLKKQVQDTVAENKEREQDTRKKTFKREVEVENWIKKYDEEMGEKQDELEMLEEQFTEEKKQLKDLEEKLAVLEVKHDAAVKEQEEIRLKAEQEAEERERKENAAIRIQKYWRAYRKHKIEAKQAQKGKKKGKGGKGKGKKKT